MQLVRQVLLDEELVPFHVVLDVGYTETSHLADIVLPWTTYLERWDIDARPPQSLVDYVGLRQPVVMPLGESKDVREIFPELARRIGGGMEQFFPWATVEEYFAAYFRPVPGGFEYMRKHGIFTDPAKKPNYEPYARTLNERDLEGTSVDPSSGVITRAQTGQEREVVGILVNGVAVRGFATPSRKLEVFSRFVVEKGAAVGRAISPLPIYRPIPGHQDLLQEGRLIMVSFKWNVHNAHRTMQSKWLQEIVHSNPAWLNPQTAARFGIGEGDRIEITSYRPKDPAVPGADGSECGRIETRVHLTEGVHPMTLAFSHNAGRSVGGPIAAHSPPPKDFPGFDASLKREQPWWGGAVSAAQNNLIPIYPDPVSGQQAWHDTLVRVRRIV
jgi:anaerobic selenocysteine-containing dehydrogenase